MTEKIRIGCPLYLNTHPLVYGMEDRVSRDLPSNLARRLAEGSLDAALLPISECFVHPDYRIIKGMAIACRGPVRSVYLAHRGPLARLKEAALDPASQNSNLLLKVVFAEFFGLTPRFTIPSASGTSSPEAKLVIGDAALQARDQLLKAGWNLLDLGEQWWEQTGLPFVFAAWVVRKSVEAPSLVKILKKAKEQGITEIPGIAASQTIILEPMARSYLTHHIRYDLGEPEMKGILEYQRLALKHGFLTTKLQLQWVD